MMRNQLGPLEGIIMYSHPLCGGQPVTLPHSQYKSKRRVREHTHTDTTVCSTSDNSQSSYQAVAEQKGDPQT